MSDNSTTIGLGGKFVKVQCARIQGRTVISTGKWVKLASIKDEVLVEDELLAEPEPFRAQLAYSGLGADIFTFAERVTQVTPRFSYHFEWDNVAAIRITTFQDWWENHLSQDTRRNVRRAGKRGVEVRVAPFDEAFALGIKGIYDEVPFRQGKRFWHYGKSVATIVQETSPDLDRSEFIGAYFEGRLIGFIKLIYVGSVAHIVLILSQNAHYDKRPANALISEAVKVCAQKKMSHLLYCQYTYGKSSHTPLTEFKRRNGFEEIAFPRYYIPLTTKGKLAIMLKLYRPAKDLLPTAVVSALLKVRETYYSLNMPENAKGSVES